jgi:predicted RNase H-like nuclease (RuvC/YqgF family)
MLSQSEQEFQSDRSYNPDEVSAADINRIFGEVPIEYTLEDKVADLRNWVTALNQRVACSVHGLGDRNIAKLRGTTEDLTYEIEQLQKQLTAQSACMSDLMDSVAGLECKTRDQQFEIHNLGCQVAELESESLESSFEIEIKETIAAIKPIRSTEQMFRMLFSKLGIVAASCSLIYFAAASTTPDGVQKQDYTDLAVPAGLAAIGLTALSWAVGED